MVFFGLLLTFLSLAAPGWLSAICEYCATYLLIIALAVTRADIFNPDERWLSRSLVAAGKWIIGLTGLTGLIGLYGHEFVDVLRDRGGNRFQCADTPRGRVPHLRLQLQADEEADGTTLEA